MTGSSAYRRAIAFVLALALASSGATNVAQAASPLQHVLRGHGDVEASQCAVPVRSTLVVPSGDASRHATSHVSNPTLASVAIAEITRSPEVRRILAVHCISRSPHHPSAAFDATAPPQAR